MVLADGAPVILAIVGSQDLNEAQVATAKALIWRLIYIDIDERFKIISGGARGIDSLVRSVLYEECAVADDFFTEYLPESQDWPGFKARNIKIAEACDVLWSIRSAQSKTYGSGWTADYAQKIGKQVHRILLP